MKRFLLLTAVALVLGAGLGTISAQDDPPAADVPASDLTSDLSTGNGQPAPVAIVVPIPPAAAADLTASEKATVIDATAQDTVALAKNETTKAEVARNPASTWDSGDPIVAVLSGAFGVLILGPLMEWMSTTKKEWLTPARARSILGFSAIAFFALACSALKSYYSELPQDPGSWIQLGFAAIGAATLSTSTLKASRERTGGTQ